MNLKTHIINTIQQTGPMSIANFMGMALSHPEFGYYKTQEPFGAQGDFTTSPEISQMFGELIGMWSVDIWQQMNHDSPIEIVEMGPGRGTLMADFLRVTKKIPNFHKNISISLIETSQRLQQIQKQTLENLHPRIKWLNNIDELGDTQFILIANELFDALSVNQYVKKNGKWREKILGINKNGNLEFMLGHESHNISDSHQKANDGSILEICNEATYIADSIARRIEQNNGAALIIDYGYFSTEYKNTILALKHHKHCNLLEHIGDADISAHVDFSAITQAASRYDIKIFGPNTQKEFLTNIGIDIRTQMLSKNASKKQINDIEIARDRLIGTKSNQMGDLFKVISFAHNNIRPSGFN